ncbi:sensor histidine kinase [Dendrosporobacter sp. 1207_IL3150]|uniref:sensor histidine kinase n=1 Tax=Dendrosporobacter sp. 1207_IL3150 TaxID=3084054 RepID=UPI002FD935EA
MFNNTLRMLTALNSLVFLLIFVAFTSTLYGYLSFRLFDRVDDAMMHQASSFRLQTPRIGGGGLRVLFDPRIFILLRSEDGRILNPNPFRADEASNLQEIAATIKTDKIQTKSYEDHYYRIISVPYKYEEKRLKNDPSFLISEVIAVSIVDSEIQLLNNLFWITVGGGILGVISILFAGYFLAKRAMIPIQEAWEKQQQFVSDASHELRSPITGIYSNAELMLRHPDHTVEQESHRVNTIMKESKRMTKLISSLLTLARADANQAELQLETIDISELIEVVVERFKAMEELNNISLTSDIQANIEIMADKDRIHQLLVIILDNAFKYTPAGGTINIACLKQDKQILISVQDSGVGIAPENLPRIFDRFFREDKSRSRDSGGTGLGLAIAKWIVVRHGGRIIVKSELGRGTKVTILIPVARV